jgi:hypothetical protein
MKAVQDLHQSAFAGAILSQQSNNFSRSHGKVDVAVSHNAGKPLDDLRHRERRHGEGKIVSAQFGQ